MNVISWIRVLCGLIVFGWATLGSNSVLSAGREFYTVDWDIVGVSNLSEPIWVGPYSSFAQGKMLVKARYVIASDAVTASGITVAQQGSLIVATNFSRPVGCMLTLPGEKDVLPVDSKRNGELGCLFDSDGDGRFDKFFRRGLFIGDFAWNQSVVPKKLDAIAPVEFRRETGAGSMAGIPIYVQYGWYAAGIDRLIFHICNKPNQKPGLSCLAPDIRVKQSQTLRMFDALGGRFDVIAKEGNRLQIRQINAIGNYTLSVRRF